MRYFFVVTKTLYRADAKATHEVRSSFVAHRARTGFRAPQPPAFLQILPEALPALREQHPARVEEAVRALFGALER